MELIQNPIPYVLPVWAYAGQTVSAWTLAEAVVKFGRDEATGEYPKREDVRLVSKARPKREAA